MTNITLKWTDILEAFTKAGFVAEGEDSMISSTSDLDETLGIGEYACGETVKEALENLGFKIEV